MKSKLLMKIYRNQKTLETTKRRWIAPLKMPSKVSIVWSNKSHKTRITKPIRLKNRRNKPIIPKKRRNEPKIFYQINKDI